jgi:hypothetical protein
LDQLNNASLIIVKKQTGVRFLPKKIAILISFLIFLSFAAGCAPKIIQNETPVPKKTKVNVLPAFPFSDADLILNALAHLGNNSGVPNYNLARAKLELFVQQHPSSAWADCAHNLIQTIDAILILKNKIKSEKQALEKTNAEKIKLLKENEALKAEAVKNHQENEQLRNDIALLKQLEIRLEKREKMLK